MRHRKKTVKLGRTSEHREAMFANMVCSLITEGRIKTTLPKAKALRSYAEKIITIARTGTLHARRLVASRIRQVVAVQHLFSAVAPLFVTRNGGYTRIIKCGKRLGDGADLCFIELVEKPVNADVIPEATVVEAKSVKAKEPKAKAAPKAKKETKKDSE